MPGNYWLSVAVGRLRPMSRVSQDCRHPGGSRNPGERWTSAFAGAMRQAANGFLLLRIYHHPSFSCPSDGRHYGGVVCHGFHIMWNKFPGVNQ
jgi:hypothetical protein